MDQHETIEFNVDEQYENEKGVFRVISIHRDQMVIRWENGEEIRTDIELQRNIAERRRWEKDNPPAAAKAAGKTSGKSASRKKKLLFPGFVPTDFKKSGLGTTWRSRNQLGESVYQKIQTNRFTLKSWAFGHTPEMHVQDIKHHGQAATGHHAKFFVSVDQQSLHYGFRVGRLDDNGDVSTEWDAFSQWLTRQENEQMLRTTAVEENLTVYNRINPASAILSAADDGWSINESGQQPGKEMLTTYINDIQQSEPFDLEIAATVDKDDAIAFGPDITVNIANLFTRLLPLYETAVTH